MRKRLLLHTALGVLFVSVLGTLSHFLYEWTGRGALVGLFTPVNESIWEHIKLLFFPMALYSFFMSRRLKKDFPCAGSALCAGILYGSLLIPVLYYTYTGILGVHYAAVDIAIFLVSVLASFVRSYRLSVSCHTLGFRYFFLALNGILAILFWVFTFYPPNIPLFISP